MFKAIIIAGLLVSQSVFAAPNPGGGKARLKKTLACETSILSSLSEGHQHLLSRLQNLFNKYDLVSSTTPDFIEANMGISIPLFFAEMNSLAGQILETRQPRSVSELDLILTRLETQVGLALTPRAPRRNNDISEGKRRMETRGFDEDWSHLDRSPRRSGEGLPPDYDPSKPEGMPMGPHDFNKSQSEPKGPTDMPQQQQQRIQPINPYPGYTDDFGFSGFRPNWPPREKK